MILSPDVPWPRVGQENVIQFFPAYPVNLVDKNVQTGVQSLFIYTAAIEKEESNIRIEARPTTHACKSVAGAKVRQIELQVPVNQMNAWRHVRRAATVLRQAIVSPAEASLQWTNYHTGILRKVIDSNLPPEYRRRRKYRQLLYSLLEEMLYPTLSTVVGLRVSSWVVRDIQEVRNAYIRKTKTEIKKDHIRLAKQAKDDGLTAPDAPDYDSLLTFSEDHTLMGLVQSLKLINEYIEQALNSIIQLSNGDVALLESCLILEDLYKK